MSIAVLNQVYDETRRLTIAGSNLAVGDFRLKRLIERLKKAGSKAPVFAKVADGVEAVVAGPEKDAPQAMLDLNSLVLAILYTQGTTGSSGKSKAIDSIDIGVTTTQVSSRILKPLMEALTSTGSGRLEVVQEAHRRGAFNDLRLVNLAINSLDDVYGELADFMLENVVPQYGTAIIPQINGKIDIKGRAGSVRRLKLLYRLDAKLARPIVLQAFESGSKEMKIAALACLGDSKDDLPHLLDQASAKAKDVRRVAIDRLAGFKGAGVEAVFEKAIMGADVDLVVTPLNETKNVKLLLLARQQTQTLFDKLGEIKDKRQRAKAIDRLDTLLTCFHGRKDKATRDLLMGIFDRRGELAGDSSSTVLLASLLSVLVSTSDKKIWATVASVHSQISDKELDAFGAVAYAAFMVWSPKQAFDELSQYYAPASSGRRRAVVGRRSDVIESLLCGHRYHHYPYGGYRYHYAYDDARSGGDLACKYDPRWLDLAVKNKDTWVVCHLSRIIKNKAVGDYILAQLGSLSTKNDYWDVGHLIDALIDLKHSQATEQVLDVIKRAAKKRGHIYSLSYSVFPLISKLPRSAAKKVEAALCELPDNMVDHAMPHLLTLKQK